MKKSTIVISNKNSYKKKLKRITSEGFNNLHLISDFDKTLTKVFTNGKSSGSLVSILYNNNYLTPDYGPKAKKLEARFLPIEKDHTISIEEKKRQMLKWWILHHRLLVRSGLRIQDIKKAMKDSGVDLRKGAIQFFKTLKKRKIPLVIFSANGLGYDSIVYFLNRYNLMSDNVHIVSNKAVWDKKGKIIKFIKPVIHSYNKDEHSLEDLPFYKEISLRKNVILLGDGVGDISMAKGIDHKNFISFGFMGNDDKTELKKMKKHFDLVITNDGSLEVVTKTLNLFR